MRVDQAIALALQSDPYSRQARHQEEQARLAQLIAELDRFNLRVAGQMQSLTGTSTTDNCSVGAGGAMSGLSRCIDRSSSGDAAFDITAALTIPLFSGLRVEANTRRTELLRDAVRWDTARQRRVTAVMVARAFWNVRRMLLMESAYNAGLTRLRESEGMAEARVRAGIAPVVDKNRAGLRSLQQQAAVAQLRGRTQEAMATLAVLLGVSGAIEPVVEASPARQWPDVESLVSRGLSTRPELLGARRRVAAQGEAVTVERSRLFPHLDLFAVGEYGSSALNGLPPSSTARNQGVFGALAGDFALGLSLSFDLSAVSVLNTQSAREAELIAHENLRQATRQVEIEIRAAYIQVTSLHERREFLDAARQLAAENLELLVRRYNTGTALIIELLDGQLDVVRTDLDMAEVAALLELADFELEASLGGRW